MFCLSHSHMNYVVLYNNEKDKTPLSGITVRLHRGSRWLLGILDISKDVLDTSHAVGAPVTLRRGVFSASGLPARLLMLVSCRRWLVVVRARWKDVSQVMR